MKKQDEDLKIERIEDEGKLAALREAWNTLVKESDTKTVELTYEWQLTHWKYFDENSKLFILVLREKGKIIGIAPIKLTYIKRFGVRARCLEFIAGKDSNYQDFIIGNNKERILQYIFQYLMDNRDSWDIFRVANVPEYSATIGFITSKLGRHFLCRTESIQKCIFLSIDKTWDDYSLEIRSKRRNYVQRCTRRLRREGKVDFYHCKTEDEFNSNLKKLFEFHRKHWNQTDTPSEFSDKKYCEFYLESAQKLLPKREIDLYVLSFNESVVSLLLSFLYDGNYILQLTAYDTNYKALSPSVVMWHLFIKDAFDNNIGIVDFGTYYPFKELWGNRFKNKVSFEIYPKKAFRSYYFIFLGKINSSLRKYLKKNPTLVRLVKSIRRKGQ